MDTKIQGSEQPPTEETIKVQIVSGPRSTWDWVVERLKELSVVFTALFAAANFLLPQSWKDTLAIQWAALDAPRADEVTPVEEAAIEQGDFGWLFAGDGTASSTSPAWVFGVDGESIAVGDELSPSTDVNVRSERVTGLNPSPEIIDVLRADGSRCVRVQTVDPSERTSSVWVFGEIIPC